MIISKVTFSHIDRGKTVIYKGYEAVKIHNFDINDSIHG